MAGLADKSVLVTGGGSGIGRATALLLAGAGAKVTVADVNHAAAQAVADEILAGGGVAQGIVADVASEADVRAMVDAAVRSFGPLHGAANVAGVPWKGVPTHELAMEDWDRCQAVNARGLFLCNKYEIAAMLEAGGGSIVNVLSSAAVAAFENGVEYCASKAGGLGLTRGAAVEYGSKGIRINAVLPGATLTPMLEGAMGDGEYREWAMNQHPLKRFGQPGEIGNAVRWLLSDEASFVTGAAFTIDGGLTAV
ncbi:SDR family oxidoreductase [Sphingobium indicum]|uniref:SDR family oxidoreductase n=1 Tax=Sphingobium indicum TaxID=332055 RepID=A0A4V1WA22_9SPHN|nr:SDR family NAD(P)-dependent oxidoreductase [Sphingobium indicum]NYI23589.1 NAD(P)-dependent dehydrogenase (short-subunit alcohol dehydrogenase family) [Sphingobium indicum]RYM01557.1 SDR family oxidoreductase [Sphingobium indicum]